MIMQKATDIPRAQNLHTECWDLRNFSFDVFSNISSDHLSMPHNIYLSGRMDLMEGQLKLSTPGRWLTPSHLHRQAATMVSCIGDDPRKLMDSSSKSRDHRHIVSHVE